MAKQRIVSTSFWSDSYIEYLQPLEKLLFLYLITNEYTELSGIYEISIRKIVFDTGLDQEFILNALNKFSKDWKIFHIDSFIYLRNFKKYQQKNPKIEQGIKRSMDSLPKSIIEKINQIDSLYIDYAKSIDSQSHFNLNLNLNSNPNPNSKDISNDISQQSGGASKKKGKDEGKQEKEEYGDPEINRWHSLLIKSVGVSQFKESEKIQRRYVKHIKGLAEKIGIDEFKARLKTILEDSFKAKNCNKIEYLYGELKAFIHSPAVQTKDSRKKAGVVIVDSNF